MELIPHLGEFCKPYFPQMSQHILLNDLNRLKLDYLAHEQEIFAKFLAILGERIDFHCQAFLTANDDSTNGTNKPRNWVVNVAKETATLHRVLTSLLSQQQTTLLFNKILNVFSEKLLPFLRIICSSSTTPPPILNSPITIPISEEHLEQMAYDDISFLLSSLHGLGGIDDFSGLSHLEQFLQHCNCPQKGQSLIRAPPTKKTSIVPKGVKTKLVTTKTEVKT